MAPQMRAGLVCSTMQLAVVHWQQPRALIAHSDRDSQGAGTAYQDLLTQHHMHCSKACYWNNAAMERFFLNLKIERVWSKGSINDETMKNVTKSIVKL